MKSFPNNLQYEWARELVESYVSAITAVEGCTLASNGPGEDSVVFKIDDFLFEIQFDPRDGFTFTFQTKDGRRYDEGFLVHNFLFDFKQSEIEKNMTATELFVSRLPSVRSFMRGTIKEEKSQDAYAVFERNGYQHPGSLASMMQKAIERRN